MLLRARVERIVGDMTIRRYTFVFIYVKKVFLLLPMWFVLRPRNRARLACVKDPERSAFAGHCFSSGLPVASQPKEEQFPGMKAYETETETQRTYAAFMSWRVTLRWYVGIFCR